MLITAKRKCLGLLALLGFFATFAIAADMRIDVAFDDLGGPSIRSKSQGQAPKALRVSLPETGRYSYSRQAVSAMGGVLLLSEATPYPSLKDIAPQIAYSHSEPFGRRVQVSYGTEKAYLEMADWEIKPIVLLADSNHHGLWSQLKRESIDDKPYYRCEVAPEIEDTLVGFLAFLADNPGKFTAEKIEYTFRNHQIRGFNRSFDGQPIPEDQKSDEKSAYYKPFNPFLKPEARGMTQLMYTDSKQIFQFRIANGKLQIRGEPFYFFVDANSGDKEGDATRFNDSFRDKMDEWRAGNKILHETMLRISRNLSYFRHLKSVHPTVFSMFRDDIVSRPEIEGVTIESPGVLAVY